MTCGQTEYLGQPIRGIECGDLSHPVTVTGQGVRVIEGRGELSWMSVVCVGADLTGKSFKSRGPVTG